jgi:CSLREA domain-containing protein
VRGEEGRAIAGSIELNARQALLRALLVALAVVLVTATAASAASIPVTGTQDEMNPNDGVCSLREAIAAANTPGSIDGCHMADDISNAIVLGAHEYDLSIKPTGGDDQTTGDLDVNPTAPPLTITGAGVNQSEISGAALADRIMHVLPGATVTIENLTITGGHAPDGTKGQDGINGPQPTQPTVGTDGFPGGGLRNGGTLVLQDMAVTGNTAGSGGTGGIGVTLEQGAAGGRGGAGGGIANSGTLTLTDATVSGNVAGDGGTGGAGGPGGSGGAGATGGCCGDGGGLDNAGGTVVISGSTFSRNHAGAGGAGGRGADGTIGGNGGTGAGGSSGGAIASAGGSVTVTNSTLSGNFSGIGGNGGDGGADHVMGVTPATPPGGDAGNGSAGGGIFVSGGATAAVTNVTIDDNRVGAPGTPGAPGFGSSAQSGNPGNPAFGGGVYASTTPAIALANTLLASNELGNCAGQVGDGGHNLSFGASQCPPAFLRGDPLLGALRDNGGPTQTVALGANGAAIDQVPSSGAGCPDADQRGLPRPQGSACDIGAFEVATPVATISSPADGARYRRGQAVLAAFACSEAGGAGFVATCLGTIPDGRPVDTATLGSKQFAVTATDRAGNTAQRTVGYTVETPVVTITSPAGGHRYRRHAKVHAKFRCTEAGSSTPIASCVGTVRNGHRIGTSKSGRKSFTVTATDRDGNRVSKTVHYRVKKPKHKRHHKTVRRS